MTETLDVLVGGGAMRAWLDILVDSAIKGTLIVATAVVAVTACRRTSASVRHLCWAVGVASLIALPVAAAFVVQCRLPILPAAALGPATRQTIPQPTTLNKYRADLDITRLAQGQPPLLPQAFAETPGERTADLVRSSRRSLWLVPIVWSMGALIVLARLLAGLVTVGHRGRRAAAITDGPWIELAEEIAAQFGIRRPVRIRVSRHCVMPATWGWWRPVVLLPDVARGWSTERVRTVLLHELAHVARWDFAIQTLSRLACALYWYNPLVWLADRRLRIESEAASDDLVLSAGVNAADYASDLMSVLIAARVAQRIPAGALAMARSRGLEGRLKAILDSSRPRRRLSTRRAFGVICAAGCLVSALGIVRIEARGQAAPNLDRLPQGVSIEVVGISAHPSGRATWWGPDGSPLALAPCDPLPDRGLRSDKLVREIVTRVSGLPDGSTLQWHPTQCTSHGTSQPAREGRPVPDLKRTIAEFTHDSPTCTLHFDLAVGPWTMEQAHGSTGTGNASNGKAYYFGTARETKNGTAIAIAHTLGDREVRVVAIGTDGREHKPRSTSWGGAGSVRMLEVEFAVPPGQIREYQLQSRPIGRFEIKDVALRPRAAAK